MTEEQKQTEACAKIGRLIREALDAAKDAGLILEIKVKPKPK